VRWSAVCSEEGVGAPGDTFLYDAQRVERDRHSTAPVWINSAEGPLPPSPLPAPLASIFPPPILF